MTNQAWEEIYAGGRQLNRYPFSEIVSFFFRHRNALPAEDASALDVGCGSGVHSGFLADQGCRVLGIDFSASAVEVARQTHPQESITFEVADFEGFESGNQRFDVVIDRCATTHSSVPIARTFYQNLQDSIRPGARLFWQGFAWDNSGRAMGRDNGDGSWSDFTGGVFAPLGRTAFFKEGDLADVFLGYRMLALRHVSDRDVLSGYNHSSWIVEAEYVGHE